MHDFIPQLSQKGNYVIPYCVDKNIGYYCLKIWASFTLEVALSTFSLIKEESPPDNSIAVDQN